ncbi:MAG: hypothetical protein JWQ34_3488 [Mucilaginibacter sp.]|nr:hypothetical protein [Mucilaginibacter sp.]
MHGIFSRDHQDGEENGQKRDEVKCIHLLYITKHFRPPKIGWAKV